MRESVKNFVTREFLSFTDKDVEQVVEQLKSQFAGNSYGIEFDRVEREEDGHLKDLKVYFKMPTYVGRDRERGRLKISGISFLLFKERGEIEIDYDNKIYEPFNGVCYCGDILFSGTWIKYRGKRIECYQKECPFTYGDSIEDLVYTDSINHLYADLRNCIRSK